MTGMTRMFTRRRFLLAATVSGLATALPAETLRWQGMALGARAQILIDHPEAARLTAMARAEIARLEDVFSLYRPGSDLSRLNTQGRLDAPPFELLDCLAVARRAHRLTGGRFDPTVQPLWQVLAEAGAAGLVPEATRLAAARARVGFDRVRFATDAVVLDTGQALTLNGIAQGYIADRVTHLLKAEGLSDVLVDTGEIVARGAPAGQGGWSVRIAGTTRRLSLRDRALATSASHGTVIGQRQGHILNPFGGPEGGGRQVSVSADSAALADALSTGLCLLDTASEAHGLLAGARGVRLESFIAEDAAPKS